MKNGSFGPEPAQGTRHALPRPQRHHPGCAGGAGTATARLVTSTQAVTVAPAAAPEVNAVIGSFNGRWAVRVENAKGSTVVVKVGGRWFKVVATSDSFVFARKSRVGATPLVKVWVAGELQNEQTVTVK